MGLTNHSRAFTLLEVLIAIVLLAVFGISLMRASQENLISLGYLQKKTIAAWVAENQLAMLRLNKRVHSYQGKVNMAGKQWQWRLIQGEANHYLVPYRIEVRRHAEEPPLSILTTYLEAQP